MLLALQAALKEPFLSSHPAAVTIFHNLHYDLHILKKQKQPAAPQKEQQAVTLFKQSNYFAASLGSVTNSFKDVAKPARFFISEGIINLVA